MSYDQSTPRCECADCGALSPISQWGFVLLTPQYGWSVTTVTVLGDGRDAKDAVEWRCPVCTRQRGSSRESSGNLSGNGARDSQPSGRRAARQSSRALRVLVVDDDELVLRAIARLATQFAITTATSAQEALEVLGTNPNFDVVISDVEMTDISGPELHSIVRSRWPELARHFILLSGNPDQAVALIARWDSVKGPERAVLLTKPVDRYELAWAIGAAASGGSMRSGTYPSVVSTRPTIQLAAREAK